MTGPNCHVDRVTTDTESKIAMTTNRKGCALDVREIVRQIPRKRGHGKLWFESEQGYPWRFRVLNVLQPRKYVEFGSLLGYSLIAALEGACSIAEIAWADAETYVPESNRLCAENVQAYLAGTRRSVPLQFLHGVEALLELPHQSPRRKAFEDADMLFVDGDHRYDAALRDMRLARSLGAKVILVDDCLSGGDPHLRHAVGEFSREVDRPYSVRDPNLRRAGDLRLQRPARP